LAPPILFISDLHLEKSRPDITNTLLQFLKSNEGRCDSLYILGDLFDIWIGDDEESELAAEIASALNSFSAAGTAVFIMHGNRDFLIGDAYAARCDATLISEPYTLSTESDQILLLHGDCLCIDDVDYMKFRDLVRQQDWQQEFLDKSLTERRAFAEQAREQSQTATATKDAAIMDVNQNAVEQLLIDCQRTTLLHGHTHRPSVHDFTLEGSVNGENQAQRIVLGDWDKQAWFAELSDGSIKLQHFPLLN
jgi:UDP-2,3-diacylglucosamine hydrolase